MRVVTAIAAAIEAGQDLVASGLVVRDREGRSLTHSRRRGQLKPMALSFSAASDRGMHRLNNEDALAAHPDLGLFIVADGLGGHEAGEVASQTAVDAIQRAVAETAALTEQSKWPCEYRPTLTVDGNRLNWAFRLAND